MTRQAVTEHLALLERAGLVTGSREGLKTVYRPELGARGRVAVARAGRRPVGRAARRAGAPRTEPIQRRTPASSIRAFAPVLSSITATRGWANHRSRRGSGPSQSAEKSSMTSVAPSVASPSTASGSSLA